MQIVILLSPQPETGKTTAMINVATGLIRQGRSVLLGNLKEDPVFRTWLELPSTGPGIFSSHLGADILLTPEEWICHDYKCNYLFLEMDPDLLSRQPSFAPCATIIWCCIKAGQESPANIIELDQAVRSRPGHTPGIDLIVPGLGQAGEWESNSRQLLALADYFGEEKIADLLPHCEAIHDLPQLKSTVWNLPDRYRNRKEAFHSLVKRLY